MLKIRRPLGRLIFNMGIAIPGKTVFLIETAPSRLVLVSSNTSMYFDRNISCMFFIYYLCYTVTVQIKSVCPCHIYMYQRNGSSWIVPTSYQVITWSNADLFKNFSKIISPWEKWRCDNGTILYSAPKNLGGKTPVSYVNATGILGDTASTKGCCVNIIMYRQVLPHTIWCLSVCRNIGGR